jgi:hypothetical protein
MDGAAARSSDLASTAQLKRRRDAARALELLLQPLS